MAANGCKRVVLLGWYGSGNLGDEILLAQLAGWCADAGAQVTAISIDPEYTRRAHGIAAVDFFDYPGIARALGAADLLVFGGGGLFQTHQDFSVPALFGKVWSDVSSYARIGLMARQLGVPTLMLAQGVGPLETVEARDIVRELFEASAGASVRDQASMDWLRRAGVERSIGLAPDPVWAWPLPGRVPSPRGDGEVPTLAVVIRPWGGSPGWETPLVDALAALVRDGAARLRWLPCQSRTVPGRSASDVGFVSELAERVEGRGNPDVRAFEDAGQWLDALAGCDGLLAMRLHAQILGSRLGLPMFCLEYDEKMASASVLSGVEARDRAPVDGLGAGFAGQLADWWRRATQVARQPAGASGPLGDAALDHRRLLLDVLAKGRRPQAGWRPGAYDWIGAWERDALDRTGQARDALLARALQSVAGLEGQLRLAHEANLEKADRLAALDRELALRAGLDGQLAREQAEHAASRELAGRLAAELNATRTGADEARSAMQAQVARAESEREAMAQALAQEREASARQSHRAAVLDASLRTLEAHYEARCAEVQALRSSTSWRLTRPLRFLKYLARRPGFAMAELSKYFARRRAAAGSPGAPAVAVASEAPNDEAAMAGAEAVHAGPKKGMPWAEFERTVLSRRAEFKGVFVQEMVIDWNVPLYQRPQHLATALGRLGYLVLYRTSNWVDRDIDGVYEVCPNVWLTNCPELDGLRGAVRSVYSTAYAHEPARLVDCSRGNVMVYEYIDHIDPKISGEEENIRRLLALKDWAFGGGADVIVCSAAELAREAVEAVGEDHVLLVPNGVDTAHYRDPRHLESPLPEALLRFRDEYPDVVGYFGAIAPWLWYEAIEALVKSHPQLGFVFIGPDYYGGVQRLPAAPNVLYLGTIDYRVLPAHARLFDVCIIPFEPGEIARTTSPLKLFEYFALEKPVVVTSDMAECVAYPEVFHGNTVAGLSRAIDQALAAKDDPALKCRLRALADENDWLHRAQSLAGAFDKRPGR